MQDLTPVGLGRHQNKSVTVLLLVLILGFAAPVGAQYEDDEQTQDHEEQDRRYYERYTEKKPEPEPQPEDEAAQIEAFIARAEELIRDRNYSARDSKHYRVQTDDPRLLLLATTRLLESFHAYFDGFWREGVELRADEETSRVFLFYSFYKFNELLEGDYRYGEFRPKGHYGYLLDVITLHTDPGDRGSLADALVHEAAHQLVTRRLFGGSNNASLWINEGLATYFGYTLADEQGVFDTGSIGGKATVLVRDAPKDTGAERKSRLRIVRDALKATKSGESSLIEPLVSTRDPNVFYGDDAPLYYSASWVLVHYLLHGEEGRHAAAFHRYLGLERQGRGGPRALCQELGLSPAELEASFAAYAKKLRSR